MAARGLNGDRPSVVAAPVAPAGPRITSPVATVVVVDDDADTRHIVRRLLERTQRFHVVAEAANGFDGIAEARLAQPHFILLDVNMPGMTGLQALPLIQAASPRSKVIVFSNAPLDPPGLDDNRLGTATFIEKGWDCASLVPTLDAISRGTLGRARVDPWPRRDDVC